MYENITLCFIFFFFFNDTPTTEIYTLSLHDALPISERFRSDCVVQPSILPNDRAQAPRSEEHTSELQSRVEIVCRLMLEKKKKHVDVILEAKRKQQRGRKFIATAVA